MTIETIIAAISGGAGAFAGLSRVFATFIRKIEKRLDVLERDLDTLEDRVIRDYVLKEDFLREMQAVHNKLDRILDHILSNGSSRN